MGDMNQLSHLRIRRALGVIGTLFAAFSFVTGSQAKDRNSPVLLVPGFNESGSSWKRAGYVDALESEAGYRYRGDIQWDVKRIRLVQKNSKQGLKQKNKVYTLSFPDDGTGSLVTNGIRLGEALDLVSRETGSAKVRLVTFSLGGIIAREHMTSAAYKNSISHLIMIASPHNGSEFCIAPHIFQQLEAEAERLQGAEDAGNILERGKAWGARQLGDTLESALGSLSSSDQAATYLSSRALSDLAPDSSYITALNARPHPLDVTYKCLILKQSPSDYGTDHLMEDLNLLREGKLTTTNALPLIQDLSRSLTHKAINGSRRPGHLSGDGVVSIESQDLNRVRVFRRDVRLKAEVRTVGSAHSHAPAARREILRWLKG